MVSTNYMVEHERPPSAWVRYFNQQILPIAIDAAGCGEAALERLAVTTRWRPVRTLGITFLVGLVLARWVSGGRGSAG